jgi:hypothetical protein
MAKYSKEFLEEIISRSSCIWDVVVLCGVKKQEGNYTYISRLIKKYKLDTSHFINQMGGNKKEKELKEYLVKDRFLTINGNRLKEKLYKEGLKKRECEFCKQGEIWNGKKISLILDHIDGDRKNNLIENLQILCPNCNATLDTHCGKNAKKKLITSNFENRLEIKKNNWKKIILDNDIDFSKKTWGIKLSKIIGKSPQYCLKFVKTHLIEYVK